MVPPLPPDDLTAADLWHDDPDRGRAFVRRLIREGFPARALEVAQEGLKHRPADSPLRYAAALAARRGGNPRYAEALLKPLLDRALAAGPSAADLTPSLRVEAIALQAAILKEHSAADPALLAPAAETCERAANVPGVLDLPDRGTFPLVNAATMWRLAGRADKAAELAAETVRRIASLNGQVFDPVWQPATLGEARLLLGLHEEAIRDYLDAVAQAVEHNRVGELVSIRRNIDRLCAAGVSADTAFLDQHLGSVAVFSGHMVDSPDRLAAGRPPRFPNTPRLVAAVKAAVARRLADLNVQVGFCSLASGGDILFAEAVLERKAELHLVLPFDRADFQRTSVTFGQPGGAWQEWGDRFQKVFDAVPPDRRRFTTSEPYLGSNDLFAFSNSVLQGLAVMRARERASEPKAVVLIDRSQPGLPGGAAGFGTAWAAAGFPAHEIDLRPIRDAVAEPVPAAVEPPAPPTAGSRLRRQVKAMLFADVEHYSRIPERRLAEFLEVYGDYLRALFASPVGRARAFANTWGDGIYAVFDRVADAAAFAAELVEPSAVRQPAWPRYGLGDGVPFRVGLHAGPVFELPSLFSDRPEYGGQHVTRAARIEPQTVRGCAYASEPFAALLTMEAGPRFHLEGVGQIALAKDYDRCPLYRVARGR